MRHLSSTFFFFLSPIARLHSPLPELQNAQILSCEECRACSPAKHKMSCTTILYLSSACCHWHGTEITSHDNDEITSYCRDSFRALARNVCPSTMSHYIYLQDVGKQEKVQLLPSIPLRQKRTLYNPPRMLGHNQKWMSRMC